MPAVRLQRVGALRQGWCAGHTAVPHLLVSLPLTHRHVLLDNVVAARGTRHTVLLRLASDGHANSCITGARRRPENSHLLERDWDVPLWWADDLTGLGRRGRRAQEHAHDAHFCLRARRGSTRAKGRAPPAPNRERERAYEATKACYEHEEASGAGTLSTGAAVKSTAAVPETLFIRHRRPHLLLAMAPE